MTVPSVTSLTPTLPPSAGLGPTAAKVTGAGLEVTEYLGEVVGSWAISKLIVRET